MKSVLIKLSIIGIIAGIVYHFFGWRIVEYAIRSSTNLTILKTVAEYSIIPLAIWVFSTPLSRIFGGRND